MTKAKGQFISRHLYTKMATFMTSATVKTDGCVYFHPFDSGNVMGAGIAQWLERRTRD